MIKTYDTLEGMGGRLYPVRLYLGFLYAPYGFEGGKHAISN